MPDESSLDVQGFGASFRSFLDQMAAQAPAREAPFARLLSEHFGTGLESLTIVSEHFEVAERPNVQLALDAWMGVDGRESRLIGVMAHPHVEYMGVKLSQLVSSGDSGLMGGSAPQPGPVRYQNLSLEDGHILPCVACGLFLVRTQGTPLAVLVAGSAEAHFKPKVAVEVLAPASEEAEAFLSELRRLMRQRNVYRGKVLSLTIDQYGTLGVTLHRLPAIDRDGIVLPEGLLSRIERQTIGFSRHGEALLAAGRHLKRGVLLFGEPGTGKTLTAMYLARSMKDRTVLVLTGRGFGLIESSCGMARALQPSIVILEDVDLVAEERSRQDCTTVLFELLNQMDGLAEDADILFLLTTNRPDILEPALAARPGRVDQAIEIPLPDTGCRRRLFDLYGRGLQVELTEPERFVERTEGASGAFMKELLRRAALFAADDGRPIVVADRHLDEALHELVVEGGSITRSLLGLREKGVRCSFCGKSRRDVDRMVRADSASICSDCVETCRETIRGDAANS